MLNKLTRDFITTSHFPIFGFRNLEPHTTTTEFATNPQVYPFVASNINETGTNRFSSVVIFGVVSASHLIYDET